MTRLFATVASELRLLTAATGIVLLTAGSAMVFMPLAFIVPGTLLTAVALLGAARESQALRGRAK